MNHEKLAICKLLNVRHNIDSGDGIFVLQPNSACFWCVPSYLNCNFVPSYSLFNLHVQFERNVPCSFEWSKVLNKTNMSPLMANLVNRNKSRIQTCFNSSLLKYLAEKNSNILYKHIIILKGFERDIYCKYLCLASYQKPMWCLI